MLLVSSHASMCHVTKSPHVVRKLWRSAYADILTRAGARGSVKKRNLVRTPGDPNDGGPSQLLVR